MNCLIDKTGKQIDCSGGVHDITCRLQLKMTLTIKAIKTLLKEGQNN